MVDFVMCEFAGAKTALLSLLTYLKSFFNHFFTEGTSLKRILANVFLDLIIRIGVFVACCPTP